MLWCWLGFEVEMPEAGVGRASASEDVVIVVTNADGGSVEDDFTTGITKLAHG